MPHSPLQETGLIKSNLFFVTFPVSELACVDTHQATFVKDILFLSALPMFRTVVFCFVFSKGVILIQKDQSLSVPFSVFVQCICHSNVLYIVTWICTQFVGFGFILWCQTKKSKLPQ